MMKFGAVAFGLFAALMGFAIVPVSAQTLTVTYPTATKLSPRMSDLKGPAFVNGPTIIRHPDISSIITHYTPHQNGAPQTSIGPAISATPGTGFTGMSVYNGGYIPSDNNIAVGPNHIVEVVNAAYAVYDKTGKTLLGPKAMKNLWTSLTGTACAANNGGDVVVLYDKFADRWFLSQLGSLSSPYSQCIAVSQTNDPTGAFYLYSYAFGSNLNDYPKFSVWPTASNSAYLGTYNLFANGSSFVGPEICAYDRAAMLKGASSPASICYTGMSGASYLPADLDGSTPPLDGTPAYFMSLYGSSLGVYTIAPNFSNATARLSSFSTIGVAGYSSASSSPQPGTMMTLDSLSDRLMFRLAFRMFPDHESIVVSHAIVGSGNSSGVRWYELRAPVATNGVFSVFQQGTYAPDASYRWMSSAAMDQSGDIGLGYSVSDGSSVYPSVRYTGRVPTDALGSMQTEATLIAGSGSQTGYSRWGDYSSMRIDPSDDCTFWFVNEYLPTSSSYGWYTYIGNFKFPSCSSTSPDFSLSASPTSVSFSSRSGTQSSTLTVTSLNSYAGTVALTVPTCPAGTSCSVSPASLTLAANQSASVTLSIAPSSATPVGSSTATLSGASGALVHASNVAISVTEPFTLSASASSLSVTRGSRNSLMITPAAADRGTAFPVSLSVSGLPSGVTASFSPNPDNTGSPSTLTLTAKKTATTTRGTTITVTGSSLGLTATQTFTLVVN